MYRRCLILTVTAVFALTACARLAPGATRNSAEAASSEPPAVAKPANTPVPTDCFLGSGTVDVAYTDISELARVADAISIAKVVGVSELQYSTQSGARPSCDYVNSAQGVFSVGRVITLQEQRNVAGHAPSAGSTFTYWLPGGTLGSDTTPPHYFGLATPAVGDGMLAFLVDPPGDMDAGAGVLEVDAYELFAIGRDGRIQTPNANEGLTIDNVDAEVDGVVPPPGG